MRVSLCLVMIAGFGSSGPACGQDGAARSFWAAAKPAPWTWRVTEQAGGSGPVFGDGHGDQRQHQAPAPLPPVYYASPVYYQPAPVYRPWYFWRDIPQGYYPAPAYADCPPGG
jgi:hypothetical protein